MWIYYYYHTKMVGHLVKNYWYSSCISTLSMWHHPHGMRSFGLTLVYILYRYTIMNIWRHTDNVALREVYQHFLTRRLVILVWIYSHLPLCEYIHWHCPLGGFCCVEICYACIKCFTVDQGGGGLNRGIHGFTVDWVGESAALWLVVWGARWEHLGSHAFYWGRWRMWTFFVTLRLPAYTVKDNILTVKHYHTTQ